MAGRPRPQVVELLLDLSLARSTLDLPAQRRCRDRLRGVDITPVERAQADVLVEACDAALRPAMQCQREARQILIPKLLQNSLGSDELWAALSDAERARLLEIREWLREPLRSWLVARSGEAQS